jgi:hypothetical protein
MRIGRSTRRQDVGACRGSARAPGVGSRGARGIGRRALAAVVLPVLLLAAGCGRGVAGTGSALPDAGTRWTIQRTPSLADSLLSAVNCPTARFCVAAGSYWVGDGIVTEALRWIGQLWAFQATATTGGAPGDTGINLNDVACASPTACMAVGQTSMLTANVAGPLRQPLVVRWNGRSWRFESLHLPPGSSATLTAAACASATACIAIGAYTSSTPHARGQLLTLVSDGVGRKIFLGPHLAENGELSSISCISLTSCVAVGSYVSGRGNYAPLALSWNGRKWTPEETPRPSRATSTFLSAVACTSSRLCTAVGDDGGNGPYAESDVGTAALAEQWNGRRWLLERAPHPAGTTFSSLSGISCPTATTCIAVGGDSDGTLAAVWNGETWAVEPTPSTSPSADLDAVSCTAAVICTAVGSGGLAERN